VTPVAQQTLRGTLVEPGSTVELGDDERRARKVFEAARERASRKDGNGGSGQLWFGATLVSEFEEP